MIFLKKGGFFSYGAIWALELVEIRAFRGARTAKQRRFSPLSTAATNGKNRAFHPAANKRKCLWAVPTPPRNPAPKTQITVSFLRKKGAVKNSNEFFTAPFWVWG